jgi:nucleoside 2-deoxyribosyltransferase
MFREKQSHMGLGTIFLSGPNYNPEESGSLNIITMYLRDYGFNVRSTRDIMLESQILSYRPQDGDFYIKSCLLSLAVEYYHIASADICLGVLNGRVPDEATVVKMGIAFGTGIPVVFYKKDARVLFPSGDNTMITGCNPDFKSMKKLEKIPQYLEKLMKLTKTRKINDDLQKISPYNKKLYLLGKEVSTYLLDPGNTKNKTSSKAYLEDLTEYFSNNTNFSEIYSNISNKSDISQAILGKVYCSGALFSPCETREMHKISSILEENEFTTFLPQRDGGEPYVMGAIDNPFAGAPIAKPVAKVFEKALFAIDINEIIKCEFFLVNLNGRTLDDGAMAELGVAFALGKPIALFKNDIRYFSKAEIHPFLLSVGIFAPIIKNYDKIPETLKIINEKMKKFGESHYLNNLPSNLQMIQKHGKKWAKRVCNKKPEFQMKILE